MALCSPKFSPTGISQGFRVYLFGVLQILKQSKLTTMEEAVVPPDVNPGSNSCKDGVVRFADADRDEDGKYSDVDAEDIEEDGSDIKKISSVEDLRTVFLPQDNGLSSVTTKQEEPGRFADADEHVTLVLRHREEDEDEGDEDDEEIAGALDWLDLRYDLTPYCSFEI
jgi:hypothetical protein